MFISITLNKSVSSRCNLDFLLNKIWLCIKSNYEDNTGNLNKVTEIEFCQNIEIRFGFLIYLLIESFFITGGFTVFPQVFFCLSLRRICKNNFFDKKQQRNTQTNQTQKLAFHKKRKSVL